MTSIERDLLAKVLPDDVLDALSTWNTKVGKRARADKIESIFIVGLPWRIHERSDMPAAAVGQHCLYITNYGDDYHARAIYYFVAERGYNTPRWVKEYKLSCPSLAQGLIHVFFATDIVRQRRNHGERGGCVTYRPGS